MPALLAASPTTVDPLDALLPRSSGTTPVQDMAHALHGRLGGGLAIAVALLVAWAGVRWYQRRERAAWARGQLVSSVASRGFALYRSGGATPGADVRALTPSWPRSSAVANQPSPLPTPDAADVQPAPWATWVRHSAG